MKSLAEAAVIVKESPQNEDIEAWLADIKHSEACMAMLLLLGNSPQMTELQKQAWVLITGIRIGMEMEKP